MNREQLIAQNKFVTNQANKLKAKKKWVIIGGVIALATTSLIASFIYKDLKS